MVTTECLLAFLSCFSSTVLTHGATYVVPDDFATIQSALECVSGGDAIIVRPGTYVENIPGPGEQDFEGDPRIVPKVVDMGADEFHLHLYHMRVVVPNGKIDINIAGTPRSRFSVLMGSGVRSEPQSSPFGPLFLEQPIQVLTQGIVPARGIWSHESTVPSGWIPGEEYSFQVISNGMLSNLDVLTVK